MPRIESADGDKGSPPPMRGKVCDSRLGGGKDGITPAHAGKSYIAITPPL